MPRFDSQGALQVTFTDANNDQPFGSADFEYDTMTLLDTVPAASQLEVRYSGLFYSPFISGTPAFSVTDEVYGLSAADLEAFRIISNAVFTQGGTPGAGIIFNEEDETVQIDAPFSIEVPEGVTYNSVTYNTLYYVNPGISASQPVELRRSTNVTNAVVEYQPGSRLTSELLNLSRNQNLFAVQELTEFGALSEGGGGGGGGGEFDGDIWDIPGATELNPLSAVDGVAIWETNNLRSTYDAQGVLPVTTGITASGHVLLTDTTAGNVTQTAWKPLDASVVAVDVGGGVTTPLSLILVDLNGKAQYLTDGGANGLLVNGGSANKVTVTAATIDLDGAVEVTGDLTVPTINGAAPVTADSSINELDDVNASSPVEGDILVWDDASSNWIPKNSTPDNPKWASLLYTPFGASPTFTGTIYVGSTDDNIGWDENEGSGIFTINAAGDHIFNEAGVYEVTYSIVNKQNGNMYLKPELFSSVGVSKRTGAAAYSFTTSPNTPFNVAASTFTFEAEAGDILRYEVQDSGGGSYGVYQCSSSVIKIDGPRVVIPEAVLFSYVYASIGSPTDDTINQGNVRGFFNMNTFGTSAASAVVTESSDQFWTNNISASSNLWTPPLGVYKVEGNYAQDDINVGNLRLRLAIDGTDVPGAGRTEIKGNAEDEGDQWCQMGWIIDVDGTQDVNLYLECTSGTSTPNSCGFNITQLR